ncbi:unnamed protein product [Symbiodinium sp. CCMP2592]|nr:unnamed protein product [Symbiodinium sp. CCMP2592]
MLAAVLKRFGYGHLAFMDFVDWRDSIVGSPLDFKSWSFCAALSVEGDGIDSMAETMLGAKAIREAVGEAFDKYDPADCLVRMLRWYTAQGSNMGLSILMPCVSASALERILLMLRLFAAVYDALIVWMTARWYQVVFQRLSKGDRILDVCGLGSPSCSGGVAAFVEVGIGTATALIRNKAIEPEEADSDDDRQGSTRRTSRWWWISQETTLAEVIRLGFRNFITQLRNVVFPRATEALLCAWTIQLIENLFRPRASFFDRPTGQRVAAYFNDDRMYHERVLLWKSHDMTWAILTPDMDVYMEDFSGAGDVGCDRFRIKDVDFKYWSRVGGAVYRFGEIVSDEMLRNSIGEAFDLMGEEVFKREAWRPEKILTQDGTMVDPSAFLGRILVPRRVRGKGNIGQGPTEEPASTPMSPPAGFFWLSAEQHGAIKIGDEIDLTAFKTVGLDGHNVAFKTGAQWLRAELVKTSELDDFLRDRAVRGTVGAMTSPKAVGAVEESDDGDQKQDVPSEDARTLAVDYDEQGERFKDWKQVVAESREYAYQDWPWEGPLTTLYILKQMYKQGGNPKLWLQLWSRSKGVQEHDRVMHELRTLCEILYQGGVYDQLNMATLSSFEVCCRRLQSIIDAYASGTASSPDWGAAKIITNFRSPEDIVAPQLRNWAAKRGKDEVELANARAKMRDHRRQEEVFLHLDSLADDVARPRDGEDIKAPEAALTELLKGRSEYHTPSAPVSLAPFNLERVSLPENLDGLPPAETLLPEHARRYLSRPEQMLSEEVPVDSFTPYWDACLLHSKRQYVSFLRKLMSIDFLLFTTEPKEHIGIFFVYKSDGHRIRLIVDARGANRHFRAPPGVDLCSAEGFARLEVQLPADCVDRPAALQHSLRQGGLHFGLSDVKDAFHRLRQPPWLAKYFCMRPIEAHYLGMTGKELDGKRLRSQDKIYPMPGSLCMGFTWSLFFCQTINETLVGSIPRLEHSESVRDRGVACCFDLRGDLDSGAQVQDLVRHYVCVDNLGLVSPHEAVVRSGLDELDREFAGRGLLLHPGEVGTEVTALGVDLDGTKLCAKITSKRFHRVRQAIRGILQRKRVSGKVLEIVVGHATFCAMLCRPLLSIFNTVYKYIRSCYFKPEFLWGTVRQELQAFVGGMLFLRADWWRPWGETVTMTDSSKGGFGVCSSSWSPSTVARVGRQPERWCPDERLWTVDEEAEGLDTQWQIDETFEEVPAWWDFEEDISILEARALTKGVRRIALMPCSRDQRLLFLSDNMGVVLAFARSRSGQYGLLQQIRKANAYLLACNISASYRWLPSELNSSDEGSRLHGDLSSKTLADQIRATEPGFDEKVAKAGAGAASTGQRLIFGAHQASAARGTDAPCSSGQPKFPSTGSGACAQLCSTSETGGPRSEQGFYEKVGGAFCGRAQKNQRRGQWQLEHQPLAVATTKVQEASPPKDLLPQTHLEQQAVQKRTQDSYAVELDRFNQFAQENKLTTTPGDPLDAALVQHMNQMFAAGYQSYQGDRLMAAVMHRHPACGRLGNVKLPRAWRALKGWRKLCPGRTRDAYPLAVWAAVAALLVTWGLLAMAVFVMVAVSSYARPCELLHCKKESLVRPASQVTSHWSLLLMPEKEHRVSKTGLTDISIILDSPFLGPKVFSQMKKGRQDQPLWSFDYGAYSKAVAAAASRLGVSLTPYQTRHSGPSIDRSRNYRSQLEVQRRGQWKSTKSVHRYEKSAKLASVWNRIPVQKRLFMQLCEDSLGGILGGTAGVPRIAEVDISKPSFM